MNQRVSYISRLAPTPNGEIHWGNLMNFALTWALVRCSGGKLWLRFDDVDADRCRPHFAEGARKLLRHLGLHWDEELSGQEGFTEDYRTFLQRLPHYICDCSRQVIQKRSGSLHYDGHCRERGLYFVPEENAIRFKNQKGGTGDFVLWRRENIPAYHLSCLYDDIRTGVNLIVRGEDLLETTEAQKELSRSLPEDPFSRIKFLHHRLLLGEQGEKLSKSRDHGELITMLEKGVSPETFWSELSKRMGAGVSLKKSEDLFDLDMESFFIRG